MSNGKHALARKVRELPKTAWYGVAAVLGAGGLALGLVLPGLAGASIIGDPTDCPQALDVASPCAAGIFNPDTASSARFQFVTATAYLRASTKDENVVPLGVRLDDPNSGDAASLALEYDSEAHNYGINMVGAGSVMSVNSEGWVARDFPSPVAGDTVTVSLYYLRDSHFRAVRFTVTDSTQGWSRQVTVPVSDWPQFYESGWQAGPGDRCQGHHVQRAPLRGHDRLVDHAGGAGLRVRRHHHASALADWCRAVLHLHGGRGRAGEQQRLIIR